MGEKEEQDFRQIVEVVKNKASLKQKIYRNTLAGFLQFKENSKNVVEN